MDAVELIQQQFQGANHWLEATMQGVTPEQAHWHPPGVSNPLGATYAHTLILQDFVTNGLIKGGPLVAATAFGGKIGPSEMTPAEGDITAWDDWGRSVKVNLDELREYGKAVQAEAEKLFTSLTEAELNRQIDTPLGKQTVLFMINAAILGHTHDHTGEISCLKGLQGSRGYIA